MPEHGQHHPPASGPGYETSDADVPTILKWGLAMFAVIGITLFLMWALHFGFQRIPYDSGRTPTPMELEHRAPPRPHLQIDQTLDLRAVREREANTLSTYQWVRKEAGVVRIPIGRAMDIVAQQGLPATPAPKPPSQAKR